MFRIVLYFRYIHLNSLYKTLLFIFVFLFPFLSKHASAANELYLRRDGYLDLNQENTLSTTLLLSDLTTHSSSNSFYYSSSNAGGKNSTTYGLYYCTANISPQDCNTCVQTAANDLKNYCHYYTAALAFYANCTLRYSNSTVYATPDITAGGWTYSYSTVSYSGFNETVYSTFKTLITQAAYGAGSKGFATVEAALVGTTERLYALVQCTPDILGSPCQECLQCALKKMPDCCTNSIFGWERRRIKTFLPSCQIRYEVKYPSNGGSRSSCAGLAGNTIWYVMLAMIVTGFAFG